MWLDVGIEGFARRGRGFERRVASYQPICTAFVRLNSAAMQKEAGFRNRTRA